MDLPMMPPMAPMLAKLVRQLPAEGAVAYEPKWDGFRTLVWRDGDEVELASRNERAMTRYFPELIDPLRRWLPQRCVVDGEIVIAGPAGLDFDALLARIHPADSRVRRLAAETPASFVAFDLVACGDVDLRPLPYARRRAELEQALAGARPPVHITPATRDRVVARDWFERFEGAGLDGVVVKPLDAPYKAGQRTMFKVKHERTADCVVAGFRWHRSGGVVGSLLLGLYGGEAGSERLHHVGVTAAFSGQRRRELVEELKPYRMASFEGHPWSTWADPRSGSGQSGSEEPGSEEPGQRRDQPGPAEAATEGGQRRPGGASRWNAGRDTTWEPLRPELVCEVAYDHLQGDRFRHATTFRRWRPDRLPESCRYDQLDQAVPALLEAVFGA